MKHTVYVAGGEIIAVGLEHIAVKARLANSCRVIYKNTKIL
jgi:hypothetical protein